jgi:multidrug resistance efflux pump/beta-lactamase regulating signal transducer with metallopeptidase domain
MNVASLMQSPWWQTAGWVMIHFLWVGAAIAFLAAALRRLMPPDPSRRYALALSCFAALAIAPFAIFLALPIEPPRVPVFGDMPSPQEAIELPVAPAPVVDQSPPTSPHVIVEAVAHYLPLLWLIGAPCTLLLVVSGIVGSERLRRQSAILRDGDLAARSGQLARSLQIARHVALGICARLKAPILVGVFKPMILLPPAALAGWSVEQLEMVLLHELAHVRRWDNVVNLVQRFIEALLFFHPAVWWISAWVRLERESCCDQIVVSRTGKPREYAETLAAFALTATPFRTGAPAMAEHRVVTRIRRILNLEDRTMKVSTKFLGFGVALLIAAVMLLGFYARDGASNPPAPDVGAPEAQNDQDPATRPAVDKAKPQAPAPNRQKPNGNTDGPSAQSQKKEEKLDNSMTQRARVAAYQQVDLYSRVAGVVKNVSVDIGDGVKRGQALFEIEASDAELELKQKTALVDQAKAEIEVARSSVRAAQAALAAIKALVTEAEAGCQNAAATQTFRQKRLDRFKSLFEAKAVDQQLYEESREQFQAAQAAVAAAEAKLRSAKAMVDEGVAKLARAEADLNVALARVQAAEAAAQRSRNLVDAAQIRAPFDGVVTRRAVNVGDFVPAAGQGNAKPLATVTRTDLLRIVVEAPERSVLAIKVGAPVTIYVDAFPNKQFEAKVSRVGADINPETRLMRIEIDLPNADGRLLPGMSGSVTFKADQ